MPNLLEPCDLGIDDAKNEYAVVTADSEPELDDALATLRFDGWNVYSVQHGVPSKAVIYRDRASAPAFRTLSNDGAEVLTVGASNPLILKVDSSSVLQILDYSAFSKVTIRALADYLMGLSK